ncbi:hypothetical protein PINS_up019926 [Pythium insidiosum]|nr:hypothetical protein PINS_up019926 [Pythium insidiosum]
MTSAHVLHQPPHDQQQPRTSDLDDACEATLPFPQMEIRVRALSVSATTWVERTRVADDGGGQDASVRSLPTIGRELRQMLHGLVPHALLGGGRQRGVVSKQILQDVSLVLRPGTMTLVLGPPGAGKSTLLQLLSDQFPRSKNVTVDGEVSYNGVSGAGLAGRLPQFVSYVSQRDRHFPTLTVKETLEFAHECCGGVELSPKDWEPIESRVVGQQVCKIADEVNQHYPDVIIRQLGLEHCQDTPIGDAMLRGVSGGERKRVTTGEMEFGCRLAACMDEISTGLDSAATLDIIKTQRRMATTLGKTFITALLQPSPEVFALFDDVLLLHSGRVLYYGPREDIEDYFRGLGLQRAGDRDVADFLLDLCSPQQLQHEFSDGPVRKPAPRTPEAFAEEFVSSKYQQEIEARLCAPIDDKLVQARENHMMSVTPYHQSFWASTLTLLKRERLLVQRNEAMTVGRAMMIGLCGVLYSTLFYQFDPQDVLVVVGITFAGILFLALGQATYIPAFMEAREVFYKQRKASFYRTSSYVLAASLGQVPLVLLETLFFGTLVYWLCGFVTKAAEYVVFELLLFTTNLAFVGWFFFLSCISPNLHVGEPLGLITLLFYILFAGFIITKDSIPVYFIWAYWLNPIAWCFRSVAINQYRSDTFDVCVRGGKDYCATTGRTAGEYLLSVFDIETDRAWLWYGLIFNVCIYAICIMLSWFTLEFLRYEGAPSEFSGGDDEETKTEIVEKKDIVSHEFVDYNQVITPAPFGANSGASSPTVRPGCRCIQGSVVLGAGPCEPEGEHRPAQGYQRLCASRHDDGADGQLWRWQDDANGRDRGSQDGRQDPRPDPAERPRGDGPGDPPLHGLLRADGHSLGGVDDPRSADVQRVLAPGQRRPGQPEVRLGGGVSGAVGPAPDRGPDHPR